MIVDYYKVFKCICYNINLKMEIVDEFTRLEVDYRDTKIPKDMLSHIKKIYPGTWKEYVEKY